MNRPPRGPASVFDEAEAAVHFWGPSFDYPEVHDYVEITDVTHLNYKQIGKVVEVNPPLWQVRLTNGQTVYCVQKQLTIIHHAEKQTQLVSNKINIQINPYIVNI